MIHHFFTQTFRTRGWPIWARYLATTAIVTLMLVLRLWLDTSLPAFPFLLFFAAIIICAVVFDRGSGLYATLLSAAYAAYFLIPPVNSFRIEEPRYVLAWVLFVIIGLATASIIEALHTTVHQLTKAQERLAASDAEKDLLLREASHRMRNDLATLSALVRLQERAVKDEQARSALAATGDRINVLARLHERLHRTDTATTVNTEEFFTALCEDLRRAVIALRPITMTAKVEAYALPQQDAGALGLIINELVTNALKYAFPAERQGTIGVTFVRQGGLFVLQVEDDGVGLPPEGLRQPRGTGMGQRLLRSMVAQLGGSFEVLPRQGVSGTRATVTFPVAEVLPQSSPGGSSMSANEHRR